MLVQAQSLLRQDCPEQAAQTARQAADTARSIAHLPIEVEACALWLQAAGRLKTGAALPKTGALLPKTRSELPKPGALGQAEKPQMLSRFQQCLGSLVKHALTPPLSELLIQKQKAWTESPGK